MNYQPEANRVTRTPVDIERPSIQFGRRQLMRRGQGKDSVGKGLGGHFEKDVSGVKPDDGRRIEQGGLKLRYVGFGCSPEPREDFNYVRTTMGVGAVEGVLESRNRGGRKKGEFDQDVRCRTSNVVILVIQAPDENGDRRHQVCSQISERTDGIVASFCLGICDNGKNARQRVWSDPAKGVNKDQSSRWVGGRDCEVNQFGDRGARLRAQYGEHAFRVCCTPRPGWAGVWLQRPGELVSQGAEFLVPRRRLIANPVEGGRYGVRADGANRPHTRSREIGLWSGVARVLQPIGERTALVAGLRRTRADRDNRDQRRRKCDRDENLRPSPHGRSVA